jgi:hypothetical protein
LTCPGDPRGDVGSLAAFFLSVEVKDLRGEASKKQENWKARVIGAAGTATIARSPEAAQKA